MLRAMLSLSVTGRLDFRASICAGPKISGGETGDLASAGVAVSGKERRVYRKSAGVTIAREISHPPCRAPLSIDFARAACWYPKKEI
jgi:hypothetical protein